MIINIDAFRKVAVDPARESKANIIHRYHDKMLGKPIDFIASCHPVVIIDEPQSVDNTDKAKEALGYLNPVLYYMRQQQLENTMPSVHDVKSITADRLYSEKA